MAEKENTPPPKDDTEKSFDPFSVFNYLVDPIFIFDHNCGLIFQNTAATHLSPAFPEFVGSLTDQGIYFNLKTPTSTLVYQHADKTYCCNITSNPEEKYFVVNLKAATTLPTTFDELTERTKLYESVWNNVPVDLVIFDSEHKYVFVNRFAIKNDDVRKWVIGKTDYDYVKERGMAIEIADRRRYYFNKCIAEKKTVEVEDETVNVEHDKKTTLRRFTPMYNPDGSLLFVLGFGIDITERKKAELDLLASKDILKSSLEEKEILLKEVHHRVKNNLSVIYSLLELDSSKTEDESIKEIFASSQSRVKSMAIVHENLYRSNIFSRLNIVDYTQKLFHELASIHKHKDKKVTLNMSHEDLFINIDQAIPLGLILNELIVNFFKYVYPTTEHPTLDISFSEENNTEGTLPKKYMVMQYRDNGPGMIHDTPAGTGVGIMIVKMLTKQIKGTLNISSDMGYQLELKWAYK